jgi:hypothetical protein
MSDIPVSITVVEKFIAGVADSYIVITVIDGDHMGQTGIGCGMADAAADLVHKIGADEASALTLACLGTLTIGSAPALPTVGTWERAARAAVLVEEAL